MLAANLTPFAFDDALVRVHADENGCPWFVAKDVCRILEIGKHRDALTTLDDDEKGRPVLVDTLGGPQETATVSESGLYALVFRSRKPEARRFRKWVTSEVLPAIRKTGGYAAPEVRVSIPEAARRLKPAMREKALNYAIQTVRLVGGGSQEQIDYHFTRYCEILISGWEGDPFLPLPGLPLPADAQRPLINRFARELCEENVGARVQATALYTRFRVWWRLCSQASPPSQKAFGLVMRDWYPCRRKGGSFYYYNLGLREPVNV